MSVPPAPQTQRSGSGTVVALGIMAAVVFGGAAGGAVIFGPRVIAMLRETDAPASTPVIAVQSPPSTVVTVPPPPPPPPPSVAPAAPVIDSSSTLVTFPPYATGHRIFVDGVLLNVDVSAPVKLKCGRHVIRIGTAGRVRGVNLQCGSELTLK
jgi:hypothetical protein